MISSSITGARTTDFANLAFLTLKSRGNNSDLVAECERLHGTTSRIVRVAKDVVIHGSTASLSSTYGLMLSDWHTTARDVGFLFIVAPAARRGKVGRRGIVVTSFTAGSVVGEAAPKPLSDFDLDEIALVERKAVSIVIASDELLKLSGASPLFDRELEAATAAATDSALVVDFLSPGVPSFPSSGSPFEDFRTLSALVQPKATSRLFYAARAETWATVGLLDAGGVRMFPDIDHRGGEIAGGRAVSVDALPAGVIVALDAAKAIIDVGTIVFDSSREASLQMDNAPTNPPVAATIMLSLFQRGMTAMRCETIFGIQYMDDAIARIEGVNYAGGT